MTDIVYRVVEGTERPLRTPGIVVHWRDGEAQAVAFSCPCGEREVYVTEQAGHKITVTDGILDIRGSCGYREDRNLGRPANWCHFFIKGGRVEMCGDSQCPGAGR